MKRIICNLTVTMGLAMCAGCASTMYHGHMWDPEVRPGPYPGVRTDLKTIGCLTDAVKTSKGGDKVVVACCVPLGAALFVADIPLSAVADSATLIGDLKAAQSQPQ